VIYAYGICEPTAPAMLRRRGLGGARLRALERGGLVAVYSRHRSLRPRPIPKLVLDHERVVEAITACGPVLPMRFGTQLDDEEQLAAVLTARRDELVRSLERVRGKVELGIRMIPARPIRSGAVRRSGRGYLLGRVHAHRRCEQAIQEVHPPLVALSAASCIREPTRPPAIFAAAYLVEADRVSKFRRRADRLARGQPGLQVMVSGPWPPYSFATDAQ
jgi:Gas vesicle synthesis protein GvpL/GvpF